MFERLGSMMPRAWSCSASRLLRPVLTLALLCGAPALAQYPGPAGSGPRPQTPGTSSERPRFSVDATVQPGPGGVPEVRVDYRMNRTELLFQRGPTGYGASYEVTVVFYNAKGGHQVAGDSFTRQLHSDTYADTRRRGDDIADQATFHLPPGRYRVRVHLRDLVAERTSSTEVEISVPKETEEDVWLSDPTLGLEATEAEADASPVPNPSHRYAENIRRFAVWGEVVDRRPAPGDTAFALGWYVLNDHEDRVAHGDTLVVRTGPRTSYRLTPDLVRLSAGEYRFFVTLRQNPEPGAKRQQAAILKQSKTFEVEESPVSMGPGTPGSFEVLRYIATAQEQQEMSRLTTEQERKDFWERFWKERDPTPDTPRNEEMEEFYRRVQYANQHFGTGGPGWKSDMGRVYIKYGPPDEVDRHPFSFDRPPEEIWYYYQQRWTFVFVDRDGFGRYQLEQTTAPQ